MSEDIVKFIRRKDLLLVRELGEGACGKTVLLHDDIIDEYFVCKKYAPYDNYLRPELFKNFIREIKLLHILNHQNVVRVFNYYLYPENYTGYILMEYIEGADLEEHLRDHPEQVNHLFRQAVSGFCHLEENGILHRDIRPFNLLVSGSNQLKIIDFGFGKRIATAEDFGKSVSLNWWCEPPNEFADQVYDYATEVYFVGKLFSKILSDNSIEHFQYTGLLAKMCEPNPTQRIESFSQVRQTVLAAGFGDIPFSESELTTYRAFSDALHGVISKIEQGTKYITDSDKIQRSIEDTYRRTMLEETLPKNTLIIGCFLDGAYYFKSKSVPVSLVKEFLDLFRACSRERRQIILSNLYTKLDALNRYDEKLDDEIPF
jgi:serine/threonine-protein kinase